MDKLIEIEPTTLTDGSTVYAVIIEGEKFDCVTEDDAFAFAEAFKARVEKHTNHAADIRYP